MKLTKNPERFDDSQNELLCWIAATIKQSLERRKIPKNKINAITEELTFDLACVIDGSTAMPLGKGWLIPVLAFAKDDKKRELIVGEGTGSSMHESSIAVTEKILSGRWRSQ